MSEKYVVSHSVVGILKKGSVFTPEEMFAGRESGEIKASMDRLLALGAVRPATHREAQLTMVSDTADTDPTEARSYQEKILRLKDELENERSRTRDLNDENERLRVALGGSESLSSTTVEDIVKLKKLIESKDELIATLQKRVNAIESVSQESSSSTGGKKAMAGAR